MNIQVGSKGNTRVYFVAKGSESVAGIEEVYKDLISRKLFEGAVGEVFANVVDGENAFLLAGIGEIEKVTTETLRRVAYRAGKELMKLKEESVQLVLPEVDGLTDTEVCSAAIEGILHSEYAFEKYLGEKKTKPTIGEMYIDVPEARREAVDAAIAEVSRITSGVFLARDLANEPAMFMTPVRFGEIACERLEKAGVDVSIFGRDTMEELGMGALLSVTKGSDEEPQLIVMEYRGAPESGEKLALVGKGIMFDSGGYSLKPAKSMLTMHGDMAGAASVVGAMEAIATSGLKVNVTAVVAACENLVSGSAYKPGDILTAMSGKTIEVLNTDAEGRLTLADALYYTVKHHEPTRVIDVATLTGACVVALGHFASGAVTNDQGFMQDVKRASEAADELLWELPNTADYRELNEGHFADLRNTTESAGAIGAGLFLGEFVDDTPWVHLDIAGTSYLSAGTGYLPKGATGVPTKTLYYLAKQSV